MEICDFGTVGLGGPTRSDRIPEGVQTTPTSSTFSGMWARLRDTNHGGGTYGFGKVALYRASKCRTIVVDTLPHGAGPGDRRLIGCHLGASYEVPERGLRTRFTGRHWWGIPDPGDGIVDPVTGHAAADARFGARPPRERTRDGPAPPS